MTFDRLSPLHDALAGAHEYPRASWGAVQGMPVPRYLDDPAQDVDVAQVLGLADASFLSRVVVKGPRSADYLQSLDIPIPDRILKTAPLDNDGLIIRTGGSEFFLEDGIRGDRVRSLQQALEDHPQTGVYTVLRQDAALILSGARSGELLRHVASYDFITDPHQDLVFTSMAGVSCSVLRQLLNGVSTFRLWTDGTYGVYTWHALLEIARKLGGRAVGTAVFFPELSEREAKRP